MDDLTQSFEADLVGRTCRVGRREHDWTFDLEEDRAVTAECHWRLVADTGIVVTDEDEGRLFGRAEPVDAAAEANKLLAGAIVTSANVERTTADLCLRFSNGLRIDLINNSSGYEGWQARFAANHQRTTIIALGGGGLAFF